MSVLFVAYVVWREKKEEEKGSGLEGNVLYSRKPRYRLAPGQISNWRCLRT